MSLARQVIKGATYLITRRCTQRQFLLRPCQQVIDTFLYCLAIASERTGVLIHAVNVMSNHYHNVATDPLGQLPVFYAWLHEFVGKALNAHHGRWENFWATEPTSCVRLVDGADVLRKIVYTLVNPVAAGLVESGDEWPGVRLFEPGEHRIRRPKGFFRENGALPEYATLKIVAPPIGSDAAHAIELIKKAVKKEESRLCRAFKKAGRTFLGAKGVLKLRATDTPTSYEKRRVLSPRIASHSKWRRIEALQRCKQFIADYRIAWRRWCAGLRDVVFPVGTFQMVRRFGVSTTLAAPS